MAGVTREIELKLEMAPEDVARLHRHPRLRQLGEGRATTRGIRSIYFDTPDLDLGRRGMGLRLVRTGRVQLQTLKVRASEQAGLFEYQEFESRLSGERPRLDAIPDLAFRAELERELGGKPLEPVFETDVRRTSRALRLEADRWRADLDVGQIRTANASVPICELELELEQGDRGCLHEFALELLDTLSLRPLTQSKCDRGYALLTGERPQPRKARHVTLDRDATLEEALSAIVGGCLEQIVVNEQPAFEGEDPEGVHQMRVGVRRLRSALSAFGRVLPANQLEPLRAELRWLGSELGPARDLDVFVDELLEPIFRRRADDPALKRLREEAHAMRGRNQERVRAALRSERYPRLVLLLGGWVARAGWRRQALSEEAALLFQPAETYAHLLLARRHRKSKRLGRDFEHASWEAKHALRIQLKKLRYATEFFQDLYAHKQVRPYIRRLARLQDGLGHLNDVATAERLLDELLQRIGEETSADHHRAAGFVAGWTARLADEANAHLLEQWRGFSRAHPFWRRR